MKLRHILVLFWIVCTRMVVGQQYNFKNYSSESGLPYVQIYAIFQDEKGYLWSGGYGGLSKFDGKKFYNYSPKNGLANHWVNAIIQDTDRCIVVGTIDGMSVLKNRQIINIYTKDGLPSNNVTSFCLDITGKLWIGTTKGLCYYNGKKIVPCEFAKGLNITCLYSTAASGVYVGTAKGLYHFSEKKPDAGFTGGRIMTDDYIASMSQCPLSGQLYVGTHNGLRVLDLPSGKITAFHVNNGLVDEELNAVLCQANGTVWIGSRNGLVSFDKKKFSYYTINSDNNSNRVSSLMMDFEGNLWIGTHSGLYKYRGKGFTTYDRQEGLGGAFIFQIEKDRDQNLWISTNANGVYKFSKGYFKNYSTKDGLLNNRTLAILPMDDGSIWFGTGQGISTMRNNRFENVMNENEATQQTSIHCFYKDSKGVVWVGGRNVVCSVKKWSPYTTENFVNYSNLPEGRYVFKVKSCNNEGVWDPEPTTFSFSIRAPFYRTWWFVLATILFVTTVIMAIFRFRLRQIRRKQAMEFEQQVEISKSELKALRAQMNPHFVFNSLNSIQHYILNSKGEEAVKYLGKFARLIRTILNNSEKPTVTINEDMDAVKLYLELEKMRFDNKFSYSISIDPNIDPDYDEIPPMLLQPYLENAILHGINPKEGTGHISITIEIRHQFIKCTVIDNGIGREKAKEMENLVPQGKHKSLGMKITQDRVRILNRMYNSHLSVNVIDLYDAGQKAAGTKVEIFIPYLK